MLTKTQLKLKNLSENQFIALEQTIELYGHTKFTALGHLSLRAAKIAIADEKARRAAADRGEEFTNFSDLTNPDPRSNRKS